MKGRLECGGAGGLSRRLQQSTEPPSPCGRTVDCSAPQAGCDERSRETPRGVHRVEMFQEAQQGLGGLAAVTDRRRPPALASPYMRYRPTLVRLRLAFTGGRPSATPSTRSICVQGMRGCRPCRQPYDVCRTTREKHAAARWEHWQAADAWPMPILPSPAGACLGQPCRQHVAGMGDAVRKGCGAAATGGGDRRHGSDGAAGFMSRSRGLSSIDRSILSSTQVQRQPLGLSPARARSLPSPLGPPGRTQSPRSLLPAARELQSPG